MENSSTIINELTYTVSRTNGKFDATKMVLKIALPVDSYQFERAWDISKIIQGRQQNAVVVIIKKATNPGMHLPQYSSSFINHNITLSSMQRHSSTTFNPSLADSIVIVFHDDHATPASITTDVAHFYSELEECYSRINEMPYQKDIHFLPRKAGMSIVPKI